MAAGLFQVGQGGSWGAEALGLLFPANSCWLSMGSSGEAVALTPLSLGPEDGDLMEAASRSPWPMSGHLCIHCCFREGGLGSGSQAGVLTVSVSLQGPTSSGPVSHSFLSQGGPRVGAAGWEQTRGGRGGARGVSALPAAGRVCVSSSGMYWGLLGARHRVPSCMNLKAASHPLPHRAPCRP